MTAANEPARHRRYLIDHPTQLTAALHVIAVLACIGLLDALAVVVLSDGEVRGSDSLADASLLLLSVHAACFVLGGLLLFWTIVKLTHRFVGPAHVMRSALEGMRKGEYGLRLSLRRKDSLGALADEIDALRQEIATRDVHHARTVHRLERGLEEDDAPAVRDSLRALGSALPAMPPRPHAEVERRSA